MHVLIKLITEIERARYKKTKAKKKEKRENFQGLNKKKKKIP